MSAFIYLCLFAVFFKLRKTEILIRINHSINYIRIKQASHVVIFYTQTCVFARLRRRKKNRRKVNVLVNLSTYVSLGAALSAFHFRFPRDRGALKCENSSGYVADNVAIRNRNTAIDVYYRTSFDAIGS